MDLKDIQNLIRFVSKSEVSEVCYKTQQFEITIKTSNGNLISNLNPSSTPEFSKTIKAKPVVSEQKTINEADESNSNYLTIKSPMIGTFYRRSAPDKDDFVSVGDQISVGTTVCIIEAMKLFNEIESDISGKIVKVLIDDASPVEYDQPLFLVDPS